MKLIRFVKSIILVVGLVASISSASAALIVNAAQSITELVTVQPIVLSDTGGGNTAEFFGDAGQQSIIEGMVDTIWAQAGIDVDFLAPTSWNNTFANWGAGGPPNNGGATRPTFDLSTVLSDGVAAGVTNADPNVINMFFVNIAAGFALLNDNTAAGLAFIGANGVTQYVGSNLLSFTGGQEVIASVVSHEIGHNLGLPHIVDTENLMQTGSGGERLNAAQVSIALGSNLSVAVASVPVISMPGLALMFSAFAIIAAPNLRRQSKV